MHGEVLGALDLSLAGLGMVAGPLAWDRDFRRLRSKTLGVSLERDATERERTHRLTALSRDICRWFTWARVTRVAIEDIPPGVPRARQRQVLQLVELRGVVRHVLLEEADLDVEFVPMNAARVLLYGCRPPRGLTDAERKRWLTEPVLAAGGRFGNHNEVDAFAVWNSAATEAGAPGYMHLLGDPDALAAARKPAKRRRVRRAA